MYSNRWLYLVFLGIVGIPFINGKIYLEDVYCVKRCCISAGNSLNGILRIYGQSIDTERQGLIIDNNPDSYIGARSLKNWAKGFFKQCSSALTSALQNVSAINTDDYFPAYLSDFKTCINTCKLEEGTNSIIEYFSKTLSEAKSLISENHKKRSKELERKRKNEKKKNKASSSQQEVVNNAIQEAQNNPRNYNFENEYEMSFVGGILPHIPGYDMGIPGYDNSATQHDYSVPEYDTSIPYFPNGQYSDYR